MDKLEEIKVQLIDLKDGSATIDECAERILLLFSVIAKAEALSDLMDFAADVCPDERCGELADIIESL